MTRSISRFVKTLEARSPATALMLRSNLERRRGEPELNVAIELSTMARTAIDIGANRGVYSYWFAKRAQHCIAFEPNPDCAELLRRGLPASVEVHQAALSDADGSADLTIPIMAGEENSYRSSLQEASSGSSRTVSVRTATLDSFTISEVDLIKIDVEGHEIETLAGAAETLRRHLPTVVIEAEERHRPGAVDVVRSTFERLDYSGYFLFDGKAHPISEFEVEIHQIPPSSAGARTATYANNFIFVPKHRTEQIATMDALR